MTNNKRTRLLVIEVYNGVVDNVQFDTGEELDVSVAIIDHGESRIYRIGEAHSGGAEEIIAAVKSDECRDGLDCGAHGYTDEDDESE